MNEKRISLRIDDRTMMLLRDLSKKLNISVSKIVRVITTSSIEKLLDKDGNWKSDINLKE